MKMLSPFAAQKLTKPLVAAVTVVAASTGSLPWGKLRDTAKSTLSTLLTLAPGILFGPNKRRVFQLSNGDLILFGKDNAQISTLAGSTGSTVTIASGATISDIVQSRANPNVFLLTADNAVYKVTADSSQGMAAVQLLADVSANTGEALTHRSSVKLFWDTAQALLIVAYLKPSGTDYAVVTALYSVGTSSLTFKSTSTAPLTFGGASVVNSTLGPAALTSPAAGAPLYAAATATSGSTYLGAAKITYTTTTISAATPGIVSVGSNINVADTRLLLQEDLAVLHDAGTVTQLWYDGSWQNSSASGAGSFGVEIHDAPDGDTLTADASTALKGQRAGLPFTLEHTQTASYNAAHGMALSDATGIAFADTDGTNLRLRLLRQN